MEQSFYFLEKSLRCEKTREQLKLISTYLFQASITSCFSFIESLLNCIGFNYLSKFDLDYSRFSKDDLEVLINQYVENGGLKVSSMPAYKRFLKLPRLMRGEKTSILIKS